MHYSHVLLFFSLITPAFAQDGGQLFGLYCSACHGADGKGAANGTFPPLAQSPYVADAPDRSIKIVLHGLNGPVNVLGKTYNLEMPPQGAAMTDDQIAAVLTYVRSSWGNKADAVTSAQVKLVRTATASRTEHWTGPELLKLHPIQEKKPLTNLLSFAYSGNWDSAPDFSTLKPAAAEEEPTGKISLPNVKGKKNNASKNKLGMAWEGTLTLPTTGDYEFLLAADDGGSISLDGKLITAVTGAGPIKGREKQAVISSTAGPHQFRADYYDLLGVQAIQIAWRQKGKKEWNYLTEDSTPPKSWPPIILKPTDRPIIYRNFIEKTSPRAIGVGFPGGVNLAYSVDNLAPELIWTGSFIDAGHHWTDRGIGNEPPAGQNVIKLTTSPTLDPKASFRGYKLDPSGNPSFSTQLDQLSLLDSYSTSAATLIRSIKVTGKSSSPVALTLVEGLTVTSASADTFDIDGKLTITAKSAQIREGKLVLPLVPGTGTEIRYSWK